MRVEFPKLRDKSSFCALRSSEWLLHSLLFCDNSKNRHLLRNYSIILKIRKILWGCGPRPQQAPNTDLWLIPKPLAVFCSFWSFRSCLIFFMNLLKLALRPSRSLSICSTHSLVVSTNSTVAGSSKRVATIVCIALNSVSFSFTWTAICDTSSYHGWPIFKYLASWVCSFCSSGCSLLFSPIFHMRYNEGMSFITATISSNSCWFFCNSS